MERTHQWLVYDRMNKRVVLHLLLNWPVDPKTRLQKEVC